MIDIHTHILPNVDDGSTSLDMSINMLKQQVKNNVTHVIFTPHAIRGKFSSKEEILNSFNKVKQNFPSEINYILGSEIYYYKNVLDDIDCGKHLTINNSNVYLLEFSMMYKPDEYDEFFYVSKLRGYKVIVAHPERYKYFDLEFIETIKSYGGFIQINSSSILGLHGKQSKKNAILLLKKGLVDFISSDCHNDYNRNPNLDECYNFIKKKFGVDTSNKIFIQNKKMILDLIQKK